MSSPKTTQRPSNCTFYILMPNHFREKRQTFYPTTFIERRQVTLATVSHLSSGRALRIFLAFQFCFRFNFNSCIQNVGPSLPSSNTFPCVRSGVTVWTVSCRYFVCVAVLLYFLPLLVMGCAYLVVGLTLWASEIPGDSSDRYKEQLTAKRKVTCT